MCLNFIGQFKIFFTPQPILTHLKKRYLSKHVQPIDKCNDASEDAKVYSFM